MLAGTDAGTGLGVMWGCGGDSAVQPHSMGGRGGERRDTQTHTHTHTHTRTQERTRECCTYSRGGKP